MTLSREETAAAYARHRALHEARRWTDLADLFHPEGFYWEPFFGRIDGREEIRDFLHSRVVKTLHNFAFTEVVSSSVRTELAHLLSEPIDHALTVKAIEPLS